MQLRQPRLVHDPQDLRDVVVAETHQAPNLLMIMSSAVLPFGASTFGAAVAVTGRDWTTKTSPRVVERPLDVLV